jgi:hypothetical protein
MELDKENLKSKDICRILEACQKYHVLTLELGSLKVSFNHTTPVVETKVTAEASEKVSELSRVNTKETIPGSKEIEPPNLLTEADHEAFADLERSQLLMEDPEAFEQLMFDDLILERGPGALSGEVT